MDNKSEIFSCLHFVWSFFYVHCNIDGFLNLEISGVLLSQHLRRSIAERKHTFEVNFWLLHWKLHISTPIVPIVKQEMIDVLPSFLHIQHQLTNSSPIFHQKSMNLRSLVSASYVQLGQGIESSWAEPSKYYSNTESSRARTELNQAFYGAERSPNWTGFT